MSETEKAEILREAAQQVVHKGLTWGTSGNISYRLSESDFLISATGVALGDLEIRDFVRWPAVDVSKTASVQDTRPSVEAAMHAAVYASRLDVESVLHASPFYTTLIAASELEPDPNLTTDTTYYLRQIRRVCFQPPGSTELAYETGLLAEESNALILENHGAVTIGQSPQEAVSRMEILEILCRMTVYGSLGIPLKALTRDQIAAMMRSLEKSGTV